MASPPNTERRPPDAEKIALRTRIGADRPKDATARAPADFLWQPSLFDAPPAAPRAPAPRSQVRRSLDAASWVDVIPRWLPDADALFAVLLEAAPWEQRERWMYDRM